MDADEIRTGALSERIIGCAFRVLNTLGPGFMEKVYENALAHELRKARLAVVQQKGITVYYHSISVGDYIADLIVEGTIVVELKATKALDPHRAAHKLPESNRSAPVPVAERREATPANPTRCPRTVNPPGASASIRVHLRQNKSGRRRSPALTIGHPPPGCRPCQTGSQADRGNAAKHERRLMHSMDLLPAHPRSVAPEKHRKSVFIDW